MFRIKYYILAYWTKRDLNIFTCTYNPIFARNFINR